MRSTVELCGTKRCKKQILEDAPTVDADVSNVECECIECNQMVCIALRATTLT